MVGAPPDLGELDVLFARSRRRAELRRLGLRRARLRRRLLHAALVVLAASLVSLATAAGRGGSAGVRRGTWQRPAAGGPACPVPAELRGAFERAARATALPLALLTAMAMAESRMDQTAQSTAGAVGVLQVMPSTAAGLRLDPTRADSNVLAGARYLQLMLQRYHSTDLALAAYNAGPTAVDRAGAMAPTSETVGYVANVQARWRALAGCR